MKFNRLIAVFITCTIMLNISSLLVSANEFIPEFEKFSISLNGSDYVSKCFVKDETVYVSSNTLSNITLYTTKDSPCIFVNDNATEFNKCKEVLVSRDDRQAHIVYYNSDGTRTIKHSFPLTDVIEYNDTVYLPVAQMLPILGSNSYISGNRFHVDFIEYSLSNILSKHDLTRCVYYKSNDLIFTSSEDVLSAYAYLYTNIMNMDLYKFTPEGKQIGDVLTYENLISDFMLENSLYYETRINDGDYRLALVDYLKGDGRNNAQGLKDLLQDDFDYIEEYGDIGELCNGLDGISFALDMATVMTDIYAVAVMRANCIDDHVNMLDCVYRLDSPELLTDAQYYGARKVYGSCTDNKAMIDSLLFKNTMEEVLGAPTDAVLVPEMIIPKLIAATAKNIFEMADLPFHEASKYYYNVPYYSCMMERGLSAYVKYRYSYDFLSRDNLENSRLSLIYSLLSSRAIYQAFSDANEAVYDKALFSNTINEIDSLLFDLYSASIADYSANANSVDTDSIEYINNAIIELKLDTKTFFIDRTFDENDTSITEDDTSTSKNSTITIYKEYFGEHYYGDDLVCLRDVTHDGTDEMIVISTEDGYSYIGSVYTITENKVQKIFEKGGGTDHAGGFFNWYLVNDGSNWNLAEEYFDMWQGHGEVGFRVYSLTDIGEQNLVSHIFIPEKASDYEDDGTVTLAAWDAYQKKLDTAITNAYRMYYCNSNSTATPQIIEMDPAVVLGGYYPNRATTASTDPTTTNIEKGYTTQGCNLRSSPSKESDDNIIGYLPPGTTFSTDQFDGYWYHITCSVGTGYVSHKMIALGDPPKEESITGEAVNVTGYTNQDCNLRSSPSKDSDANIIRFMPKGTTFTADRLVDEYWYHITSSVGDGYVSYKMVTIDSTGSMSNSSSHAEMERIAEQMYADNGLAVVSCYTYLDWELDYSDTLSTGDYEVYHSIKGINSKQEALAYIHKTFSARYDDYNRAQTSGDPWEEAAGKVSYNLSDSREFVLFKEKNNKLYVFCGDCPYNLGSVTAVYQRTDGDEVWFKMTANDWASGPFTADFSLVKEEGVWKIGAATYPRY